jgi:hypothetical protein
MNRRRILLVGLCIAAVIVLPVGIAIAQEGGQAGAHDAMTATTGTTAAAPATVSPSGDSAIGSASAPTGLGDLPQPVAALVADYKTHGVEVVAASMEGVAPAWVRIKVMAPPKGPDAMAWEQQLLRRPAIFRASGIEVQRIDVVLVAADGRESPYVGFSVDSYVAKQKWQSAPTMDSAAADQAFAEAVRSVGAADGVPSPSMDYAVTEDGRTAKVVASVGKGEAEKAGDIADQVHLAAAQIDRQGGGIMMLTIDVVDENGQLVRRELDDFALADGGTRSVWTATP